LFVASGQKRRDGRQWQQPHRTWCQRDFSSVNSYKESTQQVPSPQAQQLEKERRKLVC